MLTPLGAFKQFHIKSKRKIVFEQQKLFMYFQVIYYGCAYGNNLDLLIPINRKLCNFDVYI